MSDRIRFIKMKTLINIDGSRVEFSKKIKQEDVQFGDLVFSNSGEGRIYTQTVEYLPGTDVPEGVDHVGIYIGDGKVLHATKREGKVVIQTIEEFGKDRKMVGWDIWRPNPKLELSWHKFLCVTCYKQAHILVTKHVFGIQKWVNSFLVRVTKFISST